MSIINFMVYYNGVMFYHQSVDCTVHSQDANYVFRVTIFSPMSFFVTKSVSYVYVCGFCRRSRK
jgi:hypothetical protein